MIRHRCAAFVAALLLAACGGGSPSPVTPPTPTPTHTPAALAVQITWTGLGHSSGTKTTALAPMDSVSSEPVEMAIAPPCKMGAPGCNSINASSNFSAASAQVEVVDSNGHPVAEPSPTVSLGAPVASVTPEPEPSPAPSSTPAPNAYNVHATSNSAASTTLTATYTSALAGSLALREFIFAGLEYPKVQDQDAAVGYILNSSGLLMPQADTTNADLYIAKDTDGTVKVFAPGGIQVYGVTQAIATLANAQPFTSGGTSIPVSSLTSNPVIVIKAVNGYVALKFGVTQCSYTTNALACDVAAMAGAIYNTAGTDGAFH